MCALSSESIFLIQVSDFLGQISNVATQLVVPKSKSNINNLHNIQVACHDKTIKCIEFNSIKKSSYSISTNIVV